MRTQGTLGVSEAPSRAHHQDLKASFWTLPFREAPTPPSSTPDSRLWGALNTVMHFVEIRRDTISHGEGAPHAGNGEEPSQRAPASLG